MSQNNDPQDQKPWNKKFSEDNGEASRTANRKRNSHNALITTILVLVIIALAAVPVTYYISHMNSFNRPQGAVSVSSSKKKAASSSSQAEKKASTSDAAKKSTHSAKASTSSSSSESSSSAASSSVSESASSASSSSSDSTYVTVQPGEGLYRVAANNGLSLQQLLTLNGLSSSSQVAPGQQLKIK